LEITKEMYLINGHFRTPKKWLKFA